MHANNAAVWPGEDALLMMRRGEGQRITLVGAAPKLPQMRRVRLSEASERLLPLVADRPLLLTQPSPGRITVMEEVNGNRMLPLGEWEGGELRAATSADTDGDGVMEHYYAAGRGLYRLVGDGTYTQDVPHAATNASGSVINDVVAADLDGDGRDELIVAAAEWGAYDVRVLGLGKDGALHLKARRKLGVVTDLAVFPDPDGVPTVLAHQGEPLSQPAGVSWRCSGWGSGGPVAPSVGAGRARGGSSVARRVPPSAHRRCKWGRDRGCGGVLRTRLVGARARA